VRNQLFIAYSHKDEHWLSKLLVSIGPLTNERNIKINLHNTRDTLTSRDRLAALKKSLAAAKVCLLLVSADFLASDLMSVLSKLLDAASHKDLIVTWVPVRPSSVKATEIYQYQALTNPLHPLSMLTPTRRDNVLVQIAEHIVPLLESKKPRASKSGRASKPEPAEPNPARAAKKSSAKKAAKPVAVEPEVKRTFVCYAREDESFALGLATDLKADGVSVWVDQWDIPSGADWDYEIDRALYDCHYFLIVLSPSAVESEEVRSELRIALDERKRIAPVLYQPCRVPRRLRLIQHIDCTETAGGRSDRAMRLIFRALGR
jgi:TIR domain-containing protein